MTKISFTNDIISDSLTRMRNAMQSNNTTVVLPNVKMVLELLKVLSNGKFIEGYSVSENDELLVNLKVNGSYRFSTLKRVSKPGVRVYVDSKNIKPVKGGRGMVVLTTSKGVMSGYDAYKQKVGGEVLCEVW